MLRRSRKEQKGKTQNMSSNSSSMAALRPFLFFLTGMLLTVVQVCSAIHDLSAAELQQPEQFENPQLGLAYVALQAWKSAIVSDPSNFTINWIGPDVCSYRGVYCAPSLPFTSPWPDKFTRVVAGIDLNHADIAGYLPDELGLFLPDLALFHLNSNRFCGAVPQTFLKLKLLYELDLSNNRFAGQFPLALLGLPSLKYLDLRYNEFEGPIPPELFELNLDAVFLNHNRFTGGIPDNLGRSPVSVMVLAENELGGCIPSSIGEMGGTLNEIILSNGNLTGCLPYQVGYLKEVTVFDVSFNDLGGSIPSTVGWMTSLEQLNLGSNRFTGFVPAEVCALPSLQNFTYSDNYFTGEAPVCRVRPSANDGARNCIPGRVDQRSREECAGPRATPVDCTQFKCYTPPTGGSTVTAAAAPPPHKSPSPSSREAPAPISPPARHQSSSTSPPPVDDGVGRLKQPGVPRPPAANQTAPSPDPTASHNPHSLPPPPVRDDDALPPVTAVIYASPPPPPIYA